MELIAKAGDGLDVGLLAAEAMGTLDIDELINALEQKSGRPVELLI